MKTEKIDLYSYFDKSKADNEKGILTTYILDDYAFCQGRKRPAMLVIAGGGYTAVSEREKEPIATYFLSNGFNVFVLDYSVAPAYYPTQLLEASMAMAFIRENAKELFVLEDKVAVIGFSAGGHLAGCLGTLYKDQVVKDYLGEKANLCRPDALVLCYAVLLSDKFTHQGSIDVLKKNKLEIIKKLGVNNNVDSQTPPTFLWHTGTDAVVPVENSLLMADALRKAGVSFELHVFEEGGHGLSLATQETLRINEPVQKWTSLCLAWLRKNGFDIDLY